jgi:hypothetical protein
MGSISHNWDEALSSMRKQAEALPVCAEKIEIQAKIRCLEYAIELMAGPDQAGTDEQPGRALRMPKASTTARLRMSCR